MKSSLQFASRFSLPPNSLGYCGKKTAAHRFKNCIINGGCTGVKEEINKFIVLHPYLRLLSKINNGDKFSYRNIEAYWLGNDFLKKSKPKDYLTLLKFFEKQGVPDFFVEELKAKLPDKFIPNHLFQVLHVGVGRASGSVPFNIKTINNCMIRWGKVENILKNKAVVKLNSLKNKTSEMYSLNKNKTSVPFDEQLVPDLKKGDTVAVHWNMIIKILSKEEIKNLEYWTREVIKLKFY